MPPEEKKSKGEVVPPIVRLFVCLLIVCVCECHVCVSVCLCVPVCVILPCGMYSVVRTSVVGGAPVPPLHFLHPPTDISAHRQPCQRTDTSHME